VAFAVDGLDGGGLDAGLVAEDFEKLADALDVCSVAVGV
jgi:hypothetical protein